MKFSTSWLAKVGVVLVAALIIAAGLWPYFFGDTLRTRSDAGLEALLTGNSSILFEGMHESEVKRLKVSRAKLQRLLDTFVSPSLQGLVRVGSKRFRANEREGYVVAYQTVRSRDGDLFDLQCKAQLSDNGITLSPVIHQAVAVSLISRTEMRASSNGVERAAAVSKIVSNELQTLDLTGISGFVRDGSEGAYESWYSYADRMAKLSLQLRAQTGP